tara:strand:+ start:11039 stop:11185 length:147 start_codon:yes stop_codon:yes gene_type:complete
VEAPEAGSVFANSEKFAGCKAKPKWGFQNLKSAPQPNLPKKKATFDFS